MKNILKLLKHTDSKRLFPYSMLLLVSALVSAQTAPNIEWQKCLGGSSYDNAYSFQKTTDDGFIVAGNSESNDGDVSGNHGGYGDYWIVKLDVFANIEWQKCMGGSNYDQAISIAQIIDGGFIVTGWSQSNDGDVSGNHGGLDYWIVKMDASGNIEWQKSLGGSSEDYGNSIQQTTDGGFIVAGQSYSNDGDVSGNHGDGDYWIVKLDITGNFEWQKSLGGSNEDYASSIQQTTDGGFIVSGYTRSIDGDVSGNHGGFSDSWFVKLDVSGNIEWQKCLGGSGADFAGFIQQTTDDGFIVAGYSSSNDGDVSGNHGGDGDYWIVKLDVSGTIEWQKSLGGSGDDGATSIQQTIDGGFIVAGFSDSNDGDVAGNHGSYDYWTVKLDTSGNIQWQKSLGGSNYEAPYSIQQATYEEFIVVGYSQSHDGDASGNHGDADYWIIKLYPEPIPVDITSGFIDTHICPSTSVDVHFNSGDYNDGNIFTAQLSDATGSFASPVDIGTLVSTSSGTINATIPSSTPTGKNYRVRVVASDPITIGTDNGSDIQIKCFTPKGLEVKKVTATKAKLTWGETPCDAPYTFAFSAVGSNYWNEVNTPHKYIVVFGLQSATTYVTKVRTNCSPGVYSSWTSTESFTTDPFKQEFSSDGIAESLNLYPNPTTGAFMIDLSIDDEETSEATIQVINLLGQIVYEEKVGITQGLLQKEIQFSDEAEGMYWVKVIVGDRVYSSQINLQK